MCQQLLDFSSESAPAPTFAFRVLRTVMELHAAGHAYDDALEAGESALRLASKGSTGDGFDVEGLRQRLDQIRGAVDREILGDDGLLWRDAMRLREAHRDSEAAEHFAAYRQRYAAGAHADEAGFRQGETRLRAGQPKLALTVWQAFVAQAPYGPWRAQAWLGLAERSLIYDLDPRAAQAAIANGLTAWTAQPAPRDVDADRCARDLECLSGLIQWIAGDRAGAETAFTRAQAIHDDAPGNLAAISSTSDSGVAAPFGPPLPRLARLIERARMDRPLLHPLARGSERGDMVLTLGEFAYLLGDYDAAHVWCTAVVNGWVKVTPDQQAFADWRLGAIAHDQRQPVRQRAIYAGVRERFPRSVWRAECDLCDAAITFNIDRDQPKATAQCTALITGFPASEAAQTAALYLGIMPLWSGDGQRATAMLRAFIARYPDHVLRPRLKKNGCCKPPPWTRPKPPRSAMPRSKTPSIMLNINRNNRTGTPP